MNTKKTLYSQRINNVIDYIQIHFAEELTLAQLASVANFSKYHFHRIFYSVVGETLFDFITRIRLEKAATRLFYNKETPVSDIAYDCGFSSPSAFARAFKKYFGINATEWRSETELYVSNSNQNKSNLSIDNSNYWKMDSFTNSYFCDVNNCNIIKWSCKMLNTEDITINVKEIEPFEVAYIRHIGPYKGNPELFGRLFGQIFTWAGPRGLIKPPETKILSVYYDDPEITEDTKLRLDVCISIPKDTKVESPIGKMTIPGGKYAVGKFYLGPEDYEKAWGFIFGEWLPISGFQPDDRPSFENYLSNPDDDSEGKCRTHVEIYVPVIPI